MESSEVERADELNGGETPEDVAVLYSWANLQGAKYRDFSASRREYRAQMRHRAAEQQRESERRAQAEAEAAAAAAEKAAREAEDTARSHEQAARAAARRGDSDLEEAARVHAARAAAELARKASMERIEAARRAEAVAAAEAAARREEREMAEAHASAVRQAQRYHDSEVRRRTLAGPQPMPIIGGQISDPYTAPEATSRPDRVFHQPVVPMENMQPARIRANRDPRAAVSHGPAGEAPRELWDTLVRERAEGLTAQDASRVPAREQAGREASAQAAQPTVAHNPFEPESQVGAPAARRPQGYRPDETSGIHSIYRYQDSPVPESNVPAWLYSQPGVPAPVAQQPEAPMMPPLQAAAPLVAPPAAPVLRPQAGPTGSAVANTLLHSRERVASRWYALKGVMDQSGSDPQHEVAIGRGKDLPAPMITVYSMAGGVGKTSLVATLGRALSAAGEKVLLADTTSHGLLPFYFGASELRPGVVRTFSPPAGSADAPIYLVSYDVGAKTGDAASQDWLGEEISRSSRGIQRVIVDMGPATAWAARRLARMNSQILVPVAPDMNSVISLQSVEKFFGSIGDAEGRPVEPYYVLNQFDASLPLHLDVREVMRQQLGDRLLPFVIRRSASVPEALAEGMTVMDYSADAPVAGDYMNLASWLRTQSAPVAPGMKNSRWSER